MAKLEKRHLQYLNDPIIYNEYLKRLNNNLVYSNNRLDLNTEEHDNANISTLDDNLEALQFLLNTLYEEQEPKLTEDIIIKIADTINKHSMYISNGYRTIGEGVKLQGKYPIESPKNIPEKLFPFETFQFFRASIFNKDSQRLNIPAKSFPFETFQFFRASIFVRDLHPMKI